MDISVVILTWNSEDYIEKCIDSLLIELENSSFEYEIFIVDNGSTDNTIKILHKLRDRLTPCLHPIFLEKNFGTTYPRNIALKRSQGKFIIIMDSDLEISSGSIRRLISILRQEKDVGLVAPRLVYPSGNHQKSTDVFPTISRKIARYFFLRLIERCEQDHDANVKEVDYAISAMWVLKNELLDKVGLMDEKIFYAPEDVDYCLRIWKAGYRILYVPDVVCIHYTQEISRGFKINKATIEHIKGLFYYFLKHGYIFRSPKVR